MEQKYKRFREITLGVLMLTFVVASAHAATLTLISPNGHADWYTGETHAITWSQTGLSGTNIRIDLMVGTDSLYFVRTIAASVPATAGKYSWTIPCSVSTGDHYRVRISSLTYRGVTDFSAGRESITRSKTCGVATITGISPSSRTRPSSGTVYVSGAGFQPSSQVWVKSTGGTTYQVLGEVTTSANQIRGTLTIPSYAPLGYYTVYVQNPGRFAVSKANAFRVTVPVLVPSVSSISPSSASRGRTITALVYGGRFQPGAQVRLVGGATTIPASGETTIGSSQIRCTLSIPTTATRGYYGLYVQNPGGTWTGRSSAFLVL